MDTSDLFCSNMDTSLADSCRCDVRIPCRNGVVEMGKEIDYPVYGKLHEKLSELNGKEIQLGELYRRIENIKFNSDDFNIGTLQGEVMNSLLNAGLTERQSEKLSKCCGDFARYLRFSRRDTRELVRSMIKLGYFEINRHIVKIKQD